LSNESHNIWTHLHPSHLHLHPFFFASRARAAVTAVGWNIMDWPKEPSALKTSAASEVLSTVETTGIFQALENRWRGIHKKICSTKIRIGRISWRLSSVFFGELLWSWSMKVIIHRSIWLQYPCSKILCLVLPINISRCCLKENVWQHQHHPYHVSYVWASLEVLWLHC